MLNLICNMQYAICFVGQSTAMALHICLVHVCLVTMACRMPWQVTSPSVVSVLVHSCQADYETAKAAAAPTAAAAVAADAAAAASVAAVGLVEHGSPSPDRNGKDEVKLLLLANVE
jgi:hypothetical protein